ncbi:response regulator [Paenibacillus sepulcri]
MKKRVVVIDDKPLIRQAIVQTIDWNKLNCTVVGQAEDGIEGKQVILVNKPDILITDIKMPGLSGLDLAELMQSSFPLSKTILITGYQDFDYAQRAVRLGAYDFIVKPVRNDELERVIALAVMELENRHLELSLNENMTEAINRLEERHQSSLPFLRSKFISEQIGGARASETEAYIISEQLGISCSRIAVLIVRSKQTFATLQGADSARIRLGMQAKLTDMARQSAAKRDFEIIESLHQDDLVLAGLFPRALPPREIKMKLQAVCQELIEQAREQYGLLCCIAVSSQYKQLRELPEAFAEASTLMDSSFFRAEEPVLFPENGHAAGEMGKQSIIRDLEQFNQMLEHATSGEMIKHLEKVLEQIRGYSEGNILVAKGLLSDVCLVAARYYFRLTGDEFGMNKRIDEILDDVYRLPNMQAASDYLALFVKGIKTKLENGDKEYSLVVKKSVDYINNHFAENLSLTLVADHLGISSSYLSRLLRMETGINFVDLVYKARIEAAKRLLKDPKNKVNEVGEMVGYKEYAYFYQVFKKIEGISPKEYKNRGSEM